MAVEPEVRADVVPERIDAARVEPCCSPVEQAACCEPEAKQDCCTASDERGCGCR